MKLRDWGRWRICQQRQCCGGPLPRPEQRVELNRVHRSVQLGVIKLTNKVIQIPILKLIGINFKFI